MKFRILAAVAAATVAISMPVIAQQANSDARAVQAGSYVVETSHTRVLFSLNHFGFNDYYGEFADATGSLVIDPKNPAASKLDVSVPVASVSTSNATLDEELKGADWFDAAQFPAIRFVSIAVQQTGANTAKVTGNLTMHGVTKPVVLDATFNAAGANPLSKTFTTGFHVQGMIRRSDFGVDKYVLLVGDEVKLVICGAFEKIAA
ncbi:MAG: YceI family protein [Sphingomonadaceae bacterium]